MDNLQDYKRIKEAARFFGVLQGTLCRSAKVATYRRPLKGYRLYKRPDLEALLQEVNLSSKVKGEHI